MAHLVCTFHTVTHPNLWLWLWNHFEHLDIVCRRVK